MLKCWVSAPQQRAQTSCFGLFDISAAFNVIQQCLLLQQLSSWLGVLLYSGSNPIHVHVCTQEPSLQPIIPAPSTFLWRPQGSYLGPLLFTLNTTPLSYLTESSYVHHHLYAYDTQLFTFSSPNSFTTSNAQLLTVVNQIC